MIRTGAQYIESLRDARAVFVGGERVSDVTAHPAFRAAVRSIAGLYDLAAAPEHRDTDDLSVARRPEPPSTRASSCRARRPTSRPAGEPTGCGPRRPSG